MAQEDTGGLAGTGRRRKSVPRCIRERSQPLLLIAFTVAVGIALAVGGASLAQATPASTTVPAIETKTLRVWVFSDAHVGADRAHGSRGFGLPQRFGQALGGLNEVPLGSGYCSPEELVADLYRWQR
jgi:hypothetical protein